MPYCCGCIAPGAFAKQVAPKGVTYELIRVAIWLWAYSFPGCCKPSGPDRALHGSFRHPFGHVSGSPMFSPNATPQRWFMGSLNWVLQTWDEWSVVAIIVEVVIAVVVVDVGDIRIAKSRCAPCHRQGCLTCVFTHRCNTPFWEVRKKLKILGSQWQ